MTSPLVCTLNSKHRWDSPRLNLHLYQRLSLLVTGWMMRNESFCSALSGDTGPGTPEFSKNQETFLVGGLDASSTGHFSLTDEPIEAFTTSSVLQSERGRRQRQRGQPNVGSPLENERGWIEMPDFTFQFQRNVSDVNTFPDAPDFTAVESLVRFFHIPQVKRHIPSLTRYPLHPSVRPGYRAFGIKIIHWTSVRILHPPASVRFRPVQLSRMMTH